MSLLKIDGQFYETEKSEVTGVELRCIAGIGEDRQLFLKNWTVRDALALGEDDAVVNLTQGMEFFTAPYVFKWRLKNDALERVLVPVSARGPDGLLQRRPGRGDRIPLPGRSAQRPERSKGNSPGGGVNG